jgi:glutathione S-transferase
LFDSDKIAGYKISIMLEELKAAYGKDYAMQIIDIGESVQKDQWFTELGPNGRVPVLVDHDNAGIAIMEGQAILHYLVRNYDPDFKFWFRGEQEQVLCEQWMGFAQSHLGPISAESVWFGLLSYRLTTPLT